MPWIQVSNECHWLKSNATGWVCQMVKNFVTAYYFEKLVDSSNVKVCVIPLDWKKWKDPQLEKICKCGLCVTLVYLWMLVTMDNVYFEKCKRMLCYFECRTLNINKINCQIIKTKVNSKVKLHLAPVAFVCLCDRSSKWKSSKSIWVSVK